MILKAPPAYARAFKFMHFPWRSLFQKKGIGWHSTIVDTETAIVLAIIKAIVANDEYRTRA
jgi:hypothetical protein